MELIFATHNSNKLKEVISQLPTHIKIHSLTHLGFHKEIPEPYNTLEANATTKAEALYHAFKLSCFSDDTGLFVPILNGAPGVFSARYAGENATPAQNINKLLAALKGKKDRKAYFKTVIALKTHNFIIYFKGSVHGVIAEAPVGIGGFGYDPIFIPSGYTKSFAQLPLHIKQQIGHRGKAISKLVSYLKTQGN